MACAWWLGLVVRPDRVVKLLWVGVAPATGLQDWLSAPRVVLVAELQVWLSAPWVALALLPVGQREGWGPTRH